MKIFSILLCAILFFIKLSGQGLTAEDAAIEVSALINASPARIVLKWPYKPNVLNYKIYRKLKTDSSWGIALDSNISGDAIYYIDDRNIIQGRYYEYKIQKTVNVPNGAPIAGYGYICAGSNIPMVEARGKLILLVDSSFTQELSGELQRLEEDITGDGWEIIRYDIKRDKPVDSIKAIIKNEYHKDILNVKAVFIVGHLAVPYSGNINPDGHADHKGAWPADVFYGDMDGEWPDIMVNNSTAASQKNRNIPGDGKFDPSELPSDADLQVGRVDLFDMPAFALSERELLKQYLDKNHNFRHSVFTTERRGLIDSNFGYYTGEAFGSNGWRNFAPMFGAAKLDTLDYFTTLNSQSYLWAEGDGGGTYTSCDKVGQTQDFNIPVKAVFNLFYGSYFADWNVTNNFLRGPLASPGYALTSVSAGRPHCQFHHMALGENIGYSMRLSQNNTDKLYISNRHARYVHMALMGDPTLRMHPVAPVLNLQIDKTDLQIHLTWNASVDDVMGYNVYRANDINGPYIKVNPVLVTGLSFTDMLPLDKKYTYMVRALKLENSASGSYYNLSQGIFKLTDDETATGVNKILEQQMAVYPNPSLDIFNINFNTSYTGKIFLIVKNSVGQIVKESEIEKINTSLEFPLSLEGQPVGLYLLNIKTSEGSFVKKIIKH